MFLAEVIGQVVATKKDESMTGRKLLLLRPKLVDEAKPDRFRDGVNTIVAVDTVGAGEGELVMFCQGSSARQAGGLKQIPVDADRDTRVGLAGSWEGVVEGPTETDKGRLAFDLETGRHTAVGAMKVYTKDGVRIVPIERVKVEDGVFTGKTAPYQSATCNCTVNTEFRGLVKGDVIDGTFTSTMVKDGQKSERAGSWSLYRESK